MKINHDIRTLCYKCKTDYENTNDYYICRANHKQTDKKLCGYCSKRNGYDYELIPKGMEKQATKEIKRGDIYYAALDPVVGSEQGGTRPVLILQNDTGNKFSPTTVVAAITGREKKNLLTHVPVNIPELPQNSIALLEQIRTIDKQRLAEYISCLNNIQMQKIEEAIEVSLGMNYLEGLK